MRLCLRKAPTVHPMITKEICNNGIYLPGVVRTTFKYWDKKERNWKNSWRAGYPKENGHCIVPSDAIDCHSENVSNKAIDIYHGDIYDPV